MLRHAGVVVVSPEEDAERRGDVLRSGDGAWQPGGSTWQSVQRGAGSVEIDYLSGEIVLLGRLHGIPTPVNELLQRVVAEVARERRAGPQHRRRRPARPAALSVVPPGLGARRWRASHLDQRRRPGLSPVPVIVGPAPREAR